MSDDQNNAGNNGCDPGSDDEQDDTIKVPRTTTSPAILSQLRHAQLARQAHGLGAGGTGVVVWRIQRLTALALVPLTLWFVVSVVNLCTAPHADARDWLAFPVNSGLMALYLVFALRHGVTGIQIVMEDYVRNDLIRTLWMLLIKAGALVLGAAAVVALIRLGTSHGAMP